jgi:hypothetical protein
VIFIENPHEPAFASKLPAWWKGSLADAGCFVIVPLCVRGVPAGFLYGDWLPGADQCELGPVEFGLLGDLRSLVVRSLDQRHQFAAPATTRA